MFYWIYDYSTWLMAVLFTLSFAAVSIVGLMLFRRLCHRWLHRDPRVNEMVGFSMASFSMLYGLLLGLLAVAAYQGFSATSDLVTKEASVLSALYRVSGALPEPVGSDLERQLRDYTREVIDRSWPAQRVGIVPAGASPLVSAYIDSLHRFEPTTLREQNIQSDALTLANEMVETRQARLLGVNGGIPSLLWGVVLAGAFVNVFLMWMLDMARNTHLILTGLVGGFLGLVIFQVAAMDYPFRGEVSVSADAFEAIYQTLMVPGSGR